MTQTLTAIPAGITVNELIRAMPATVDAFNRFGIDACCGGAVPIAEAAERDGADVTALLSALEAIVRSGS